MLRSSRHVEMYRFWSAEDYFRLPSFFSWLTKADFLFWQDEVVESFFPYLDSRLKMLNDKTHEIESDEAETMLEDLYCASTVLGFKSMASKILELRALIHKNPKNRRAAQSDFFFLKCEAHIAWTEWYCHRTLIDRYGVESECKPAPSLDCLGSTNTASLSEERAIWIIPPQANLQGLDVVL